MYQYCYTLSDKVQQFETLWYVYYVSLMISYILLLSLY